MTNASEVKTILYRLLSMLAGRNVMNYCSNRSQCGIWYMTYFKNVTLSNFGQKFIAVLISSCLLSSPFKTDESQLKDVNIMSH